MSVLKKVISFFLVASMIILSTGCGRSSNNAENAAPTETPTEAPTEAPTNAPTEAPADTSKVPADYVQKSNELMFNQSGWNYDSKNDVYWKNGVEYCTDPETLDYETMGIYVPGAYMSATDNGDGTYTCAVNKGGQIKEFTAATAPIVFPVNTEGYSAQASPTDYSYEDVSEYLKAGFIYVNAGMRGRDNGYDENKQLLYSGGAPWGVTDLKAAVRYYRFNKELLPGDSESIFTFGHSGGGAQSVLMGATGDSEMYYKYLTTIGAAMYDADGNYISDAVKGVMGWCPITSLDYANEAYEWNMGQYFTEGTRADGTWTAVLSDDLAEAYALYINELGLKDDDGKALTLEATDQGIYTAGSYYDYIKSEIEESLSDFLSDTKFPYTKSDGNNEGKTYATAEDYISGLNSKEKWITYDKDKETATITSIEAFVKHSKKASKPVPAFDDLNLNNAENMLFGTDESDALHFDPVLAKLLSTNTDKYKAFSDFSEDYATSYQDSLGMKDKLNSDIQERMNMYNPMYFLMEYYEGYQKSTVAPYWRIHSGIEQEDTAVTVEANLELALENYKGVEDVDFEIVWGQGHTTAERTGDSTMNFIEWVKDCLDD